MMAQFFVSTQAIR